jgi:hypothetical protein
MRRTLGTLLTCAVLAGATACGSSTSSTASGGPSSAPAGSASWPPGPIAGAQVLPLISLTGAGGHSSRLATPLNTESQIKAFSRQFRGPGMQTRIHRALGNQLTAPDHDLVGTVVSVGCDQPPGVDVVADAQGRVQLVPHAVASPLQECLAAVTTVAVAVLPQN